MNVFNRFLAGAAAVVLTATAFALPALDGAKAPVAQVAYHGIKQMAQTVLVAAVRKVEAR